MQVTHPEKWSEVQEKDSKLKSFSFGMLFTRNGKEMQVLGQCLVNLNNLCFMPAPISVWSILLLRKTVSHIKDEPSIISNLFFIKGSWGICFLFPFSYWGRLVLSLCPFLFGGNRSHLFFPTIFCLNRLFVLFLNYLRLF